MFNGTCVDIDASKLACRHNFKELAWTLKMRMSNKRINTVYIREKIIILPILSPALIDFFMLIFSSALRIA
jgi:hypothetical protein